MAVFFLAIRLVRKIFRILWDSEKMFEIIRGQKTLMNSNEVYEDLETLKRMKKSGYKFRLNGKFVSDVKAIVKEGRI